LFGFDFVPAGLANRTLVLLWVDQKNDTEKYPKSPSHSKPRRNHRTVEAVWPFLAARCTQTTKKSVAPAQTTPPINPTIITAKPLCPSCGAILRDQIVVTKPATTQPYMNATTTMIRLNTITPPRRPFMDFEYTSQDVWVNRTPHSPALGSYRKSGVFL
jgi:hypothetical protein